MNICMLFCANDVRNAYTDLDQTDSHCGWIVILFFVIYGKHVSSQDFNCHTSKLSNMFTTP